MVRTNMEQMGALKDNARALYRKGYLNPEEYGAIKHAFKRNVKSRSRLTKQEQIIREINALCC